MSLTGQLTQIHRAQQLLLRRATVAEMAKLWPALDWARLDATYPDFAVRVGALVQSYRLTSAGLASQYLRAFRKASSVPGELKVLYAEPLIVDQLVTSLRVTSVVAVKNATAVGTPLDVAMSNALVMSSGAMSRLVLNAGRETIARTTVADPQARGWHRILGGHGCDFCRLLVSRGDVYTAATAAFASHGGCGCGAAPAY